MIKREGDLPQVSMYEYVYKRWYNYKHINSEIESETLLYVTP